MFIFNKNGIRKWLERSSACNSKITDPLADWLYVGLSGIKDIGLYDYCAPIRINSSQMIDIRIFPNG
jgi:hypothetical protein